jgi:hypothetical protein
VERFDRPLSARIRNESPEPITVAIDQSGHGLLNLSQHVEFALPTWQKGWCSTFGYGINAGPVTIHVSGPSVDFPTQTTIQVPTNPSNVTVLVDSGGQVHFSKDAPPADKLPCRSYPELIPGAGPSPT